jgi:hypothetical protein
MNHFHADAVRNRMRVSVHHYSSLCPIRSGTEFDSIDDALHAFGLWQLEWNPDADSVRHSFYLELFSGTFRTGYDYHADISLRDHRGRFINPDVVLQRVAALIETRRSRPFRLSRHMVGYRPEIDFRNGAVPRTGRGYHARIRRRIRTTAERREAAWVEFDEEVIEVGVRARAKRSFCNLPDYRDDYYRSDRKNNGWKSNRKTQWRPA